MGPELKFPILSHPIFVENGKILNRNSGNQTFMSDLGHPYFGIMALRFVGHIFSSLASHHVNEWHSVQSHILYCEHFMYSTTFPSAFHVERLDTFPGCLLEPGNKTLQCRARLYRPWPRSCTFDQHRPTADTGGLPGLGSSAPQETCIPLQQILVN